MRFMVKENEVKNKFFMSQVREKLPPLSRDETLLNKG